MAALALLVLLLVLGLRTVAVVASVREYEYTEGDQVDRSEAFEEPADFFGDADLEGLRWVAPLISDDLILLGFALFTGLSARMWQLARLTRKPGPVQIVMQRGRAPRGAPVTVASSGSPTGRTGSNGSRATSTTRVADSDANDSGLAMAYLTDRFRFHLSEARLYPESAMPSSGPGEGLIDLVEATEAGGSARAAAAVGRALHAVWPTYGFRVTATALEREAPPRYGVSVQVEVGRHAGEPRQHWADDWDIATRKAAYTAAAAILPVTRRVREGVWRSWEGLELDPELFATYQVARKRLRERRYDEALGLYRKAVERDPTNIELRFESTQVLEQLGLHLEALDAYLHVVKMAPKRARLRQEMSRWAAILHGRLLIEPLRFTAQVRWHDPFLPRYRLVLQLGFTEEVAHDCLGEGDDPHGQEQVEMCGRVLAGLWERYRGVLPADKGQHGQGEGTLWRLHELPRLAAGALAEDLTADDRVALEAVLLDCARREVERLRKDMGLIRRRLSATPLTRMSVELVRRWWLDQRRLARQRDPALGWPSHLDALGPLWRPRAWMLQPPKDPGKWERLYLTRLAADSSDAVPHRDLGAYRLGLRYGVERRLAKGRPGRTKEFQDLYNAACVYAIAARRLDSQAVGSATPPASGDGGEAPPQGDDGPPARTGDATDVEASGLASSGRGPALPPTQRPLGWWLQLTRWLNGWVRSFVAWFHGPRDTKGGQALKASSHAQGKARAAQDSLSMAGDTAGEAANAARTASDTAQQASGRAASAPLAAAWASAAAGWDSAARLWQQIAGIGSSQLEEPVAELAGPEDGAGGPVPPLGTGDHDGEHGVAGGSGTSAALAALAVARLEEAVRRADSAVVAGYREWILSGDPDLEGIRHTLEFRRFEARYFCPLGEEPHEAGKLTRLAAAHHVAGILREVGGVMRDRWVGRGADKSATWLDTRQWWTEEVAVWDAVRHVVEQKRWRRWQYRLRLLDVMEERVGRHGGWQGVAYPTNRQLLDLRRAQVHAPALGAWDLDRWPAAHQAPSGTGTVGQQAPPVHGNGSSGPTADNGTGPKEPSGSEDPADTEGSVHTERAKREAKAFEELFGALALATREGKAPGYLEAWRRFSHAAVIEQPPALVGAKLRARMCQQQADLWATLTRAVEEVPHGVGSSKTGQVKAFQQRLNGVLDQMRCPYCLREAVSGRKAASYKPAAGGRGFDLAQGCGPDHLADDADARADDEILPAP